MFDLRTEAEMRLHSEKVAKELALKRQSEDGGENNVAAQAPAPADEGSATTEPAVTTDAESVE